MGNLCMVHHSTLGAKHYVYALRMLIVFDLDVYRMLTRDLFAVANLLVKRAIVLRPHT